MIVSFVCFQKDFATLQAERTEADTKNLKILREEENRKFHHEIEHLNGEITSLKMNEEMLLKNVDELKEILVATSNERDDLRDLSDNLQSELENVQKLLFDETEAASKSSSKVLLLTRQLDEEQRRSNEATHQLDDLRVQLKSSLMTTDALKSELIQTRSLLQESMTKVRQKRRLLFFDKHFPFVSLGIRNETNFKSNKRRVRRSNEKSRRSTKRIGKLKSNFITFTNRLRTIKNGFVSFTR